MHYYNSFYQEYLYGQIIFIQDYLVSSRWNHYTQSISWNGANLCSKMNNLLFSVPAALVVLFCPDRLLWRCHSVFNHYLLHSLNKMNIKCHVKRTCQITNYYFYLWFNLQTYANNHYFSCHMNTRDSWENKQITF